MSDKGPVAVTGTYGAASTAHPAARASAVNQHKEYLKLANDIISGKTTYSTTDLNSPQSYLASAYDAAMMNSAYSDYLAREQMAFQEKANAKAMDFSASEAQKLRDWEELMSSTAHQREVKDMIAAGLNPILSANQGASTPAASAAQGITSSGAKGTVDTGAVQALTQAYVQAKQLEMQEKSLDVQNRNIDAQLVMNALNNETNRYAADRGASASMYGSGIMASANRYGSELAKAASEYATLMNYQTYEYGWHGNVGQTGQYANYALKEAAKALTDTGTGGNNKSLSSISISDFFKGLKNALTPDERVRR